MNRFILKATEKIAQLELRVEQLEHQRAKLEKKAKQADVANKAKSDFLTMISHELRTPMNGIIGIAELLMDTQLPPKQQQYAQIIGNSARNLMNLINNLLDLSKIEAEQMSLYPEVFRLDEALRQILSLHEVNAAHKGVTMRWALDKNLHGANYVADVQRLRQVLMNLVGNAVKFTEQGGVTLRVLRSEGPDPKTELLRFEIEDTGIGIAEEQMARLFHPFCQLDPQATRKYGGAGLGLSISARLVKLMGGSFGVRSELGSGSLFWFSLPLTIAPAQFGAAAPADSKSNALRALKLALTPSLAHSANHIEPVLVVDDDATNRLLMKEIFRQLGLTTVLAANAEEAISLCETNDFSLILMDCQLPSLNGYAATKRILTQAALTGRNIPQIVALTADNREEARSRCQQVGMVDFLSKPLDFTELQRVLSQRLALPNTRLHQREQVVVDRAQLAALSSHVADILPLLRVFIDSLHPRLGQLAQAVQQKDTKSIQRLAHALKGSATHFGALELSALCQRLEEEAQSGETNHLEQRLRLLAEAAKKVELFFTNCLNSTELFLQ